MAIEANICRTDGTIARTCFAPAQHLCYTALRLHHLPRFRQSDLFFKFLSGACRENDTPAVWPFHIGKISEPAVPFVH